jgi:hypothetical protein
MASNTPFVATKPAADEKNETVKTDSQVQSAPSASPIAPDANEVFDDEPHFLKPHREKLNILWITSPTSSHNPEHRKWDAMLQQCAVGDNAIKSKTDACDAHFLPTEGFFRMRFQEKGIPLQMFRVIGRFCGEEENSLIISARYEDGRKEELLDVLVEHGEKPESAQSNVHALEFLIGLPEGMKLGQEIPDGRGTIQPVSNLHFLRKLLSARTQSPHTQTNNITINELVDLVCGQPFQLPGLTLPPSLRDAIAYNIRTEKPTESAAAFVQTIKAIVDHLHRQGVKVTNHEYVGILTNLGRQMENGADMTYAERRAREIVATLR